MHFAMLKEINRQDVNEAWAPVIPGRQTGRGITSQQKWKPQIQDFKRSEAARLRAALPEQMVRMVVN